MGTAYFPVVFAILASISSSLGIKDMCATATPGIKAVRIVSKGENHCMFQLFNVKPIWDIRPGDDCFGIDEARRACAFYEAGLLTLNSDLIRHLQVRFEEITPEYRETGAYYLLGVKELTTTGKTTWTGQARKITIKFDMATIETNEQEFRVLGTKTWTIKKNASDDAVSYLTIPCMGANTSAEPAIYSYSPLHMQTHVVYTLCHQRVATSSKPVIDHNQCTNESIAYGSAMYVKTSGFLHCVFVPGRSAEVTEAPNANLTGHNPWRLVNLTEERAICKKQSAVLLNVYNEEVFDAMVNATMTLRTVRAETISIVLGATIKIHGAEKVNVDLPTYNITWDNGITEDANELFSTGINTSMINGTAFYEPKSNMIHVLNTFDGPSALVCHQDPNYPYGGPTTQPPTGPRTTGPPGPRTTGPPGPRTTGPPGPRTTGPPAIKGTSTTSAASPNEPFTALIVGIFIALAAVASAKTSLVEAFRVRVTAT